eukprot:CAMPEP_0203932824 /NCGR_PEP_ID=MMETSP0359-20131031/71115_1 /ASSEMBLY_ACC=CAM_ASM_000338 /TAXON_ID=268821 /ORGANISM="Scrippsiella Hangoei, Strain SHTV-5" /LENGTH=422 /DNA_ID=CAMNT_0050862307 /DNA_START=106 /DNA_END=1374 /DNA_ORIENTATION=+
MTFGAEGQVRSEEAAVLLRSFVGAGCAKVPSLEGAVMVDTARVYQQATPDGDTETTLGQIFSMFPSLEARTSLATKASPGIAPHFSLSRQSVVEQCNTSLEKLGADSVDLFYLHWPDAKTDIGETLEGVRQLHAEGKIREFGLSNYPAWLVVDIWHRCKAHGMVLPTVYQGMYNVITRSMEPEIVPVAREFGLRLYMYNPLAGGLLSGRYEKMEDLASATEGRFSAQFDNAFGNKMKAGTEVYRGRYSKEPIFEALQVLRRAIDAVDAPSAASDAPASEPVVQEMNSVVNGVTYKVRVEETHIQRRVKVLTMSNVALRWLIHHSLLSKGDGIILGVSKQEHLTANLAAWQGGPLPAAIAEACEAAWELASPACEAYFRGLGAKPGGVERFLALKAERQSAAEARARAGEGEASPAKRPCAAE